MALVLEDGSGVKGANAFASLAQFKEYHDDRGVDYSDATDAQITSALIVATDYIKTRWGSRFAGSPRWSSLQSRIAMTIASPPANGTIMTIGSIVYTFRTTPTLEYDIGIGGNAQESLDLIATSLMSTVNEDIIGVEQIDPDEIDLIVYVSRDGITGSDTAAAISFKVATSEGYSSRSQPLPFPRLGIYTRCGNQFPPMPVEVRDATCEYALRAALGTTLAPDPVASESGAMVTKLREKIGPIETETEYSDTAGIRITRNYPAADRLLAGLIVSGGRTLRN